MHSAQYDNFTLKIKMEHPLQGNFVNPVGWNYEGGIYSFTGSLTTVQSALHALVFDSRERLDAPIGEAGMEIITFHMELMDNGPGSGGVLKTVSPDFYVRNYQHNLAPTRPRPRGHRTVNENSGDTSVVIGTLKGSDPNLAHNGPFQLKYFWDTNAANYNPNGLFTLDRDSGQIRLAGTPLNFEEYPTRCSFRSTDGLRWYELKVFVQDPGGEKKFETIKVFVNNVDDAPRILGTGSSNEILNWRTAKPFIGVTLADEDDAADHEPLHRQGHCRPGSRGRRVRRSWVGLLERRLHEERNPRAAQ